MHATRSVMLDEKSGREELDAMSFLELLKKGFGYVLLSMGVSRPAPKPKSDAKPAPKTESGA